MNSQRTAILALGDAITYGIFYNRLERERRQQKIREEMCIRDRAEGRLVNLAAGDGHPAEIMDMSFAIQALSAKYLVEHGKEMTEMLIDVPVEIDEDVAARKLRFMGKEIDTLTAEQEAYLNKSLV